MHRASLDKLISSTASIVAILLLVASAGLFYAFHFVHTQVEDQLASQRITFPEGEVLSSLEDVDREAMEQYAGQQLTTGAQAEVYANNYINAHLKNIGGGKTYSELSAESRSDPSNVVALQRVDSVFRGETLRGLLLNAYAFDTMAMVARVASFIALGAGVLLGVLALLGFRHASQVATKSSKRTRK